MTIAMMMSLMGPSEALACGGFFCNRDPVDQAGEDIVFHVDPQTERTTMHIQIQYTGSAEEFAWIVPVGGEPELKLSTDILFQELDWRTAPRFNLEMRMLGDCEYDGYYGYSDAAFGNSGPRAPSSPVADDGTVDVISQQQVGPYETVVLRAQSAAGLLDWLQENQFDLPDDLDSVLKPYVAEEAHFVALRLAKNQDVGSLQPLALEYPGTEMSIPIQLTAIAATPDMRLRTFVVGESRAVPDSYLHVILNDLVIDWFTWGSNYEEAITIAADEAGGQAFATDYSGPADIMSNALFQEGRFDTATLANAADVFGFFQLLQYQGFRGDSIMLELFRIHVPMPESVAEMGVSEQDFYNCLSCEPWGPVVAQQPFDAAAFAADIEQRIVQPLEDAQAMFDGSESLTRLTSSVSPIEMTLDPTFVFNGDMTQDVSQNRSARLDVLCADGQTVTSSPRRLVLADGRAYRLPSMKWFWENEITEYEFLNGQSLMNDYAIRIEQTSSEGEPEPLYDGTDRAFEDAELFNNSTIDQILNGSCGGCSNTGGPLGASFGFASVLGLVLLGRRRS